MLRESGDDDASNGDPLRGQTRGGHNSVPSMTSHRTRLIVIILCIITGHLQRGKRGPRRFGLSRITFNDRHRRSLRRPPSPAAQEINRGPQFEQWVGRRVNAVYAGNRIEDDLLLLGGISATGAVKEIVPSSSSVRSAGQWRVASSAMSPASASCTTSRNSIGPRATRSLSSSNR